MIPIFNSANKQIANPDGTMAWAKTTADVELCDCNNITIDFAGNSYPVWKYIEMYCPIVDKRGKKYPLRLNDAQIKTYKSWDEQMGELGYVRCNEGKGRQMGSSTLICAVLWTLMSTRPGYRVGILADTEAKGCGLLQKYRFFYINTPDPLRSILQTACVCDNSHELSFDFGNGLISGVQVIVANDNAGASYTFQAIHESEVALWNRIGDTIAALEQTVADVAGTFIVRETTARGPNEWKGFYEFGKNGRSEFRSIFLAWYLIRSYRKKYDGHALSEYERFLKDEVGLDMEQIQWWAEKLARNNGDLNYMKREYPSTEAEMWQSTSIAIFDAELTATRKEETDGKWLKQGNFEFDKPTYETDEVGSPIILGNPSFLPSKIGDTKIFEEPIEGHPYALVNDPAEGGEDFHAAHVIDCSNDRQVAVFHRQGRYMDVDMAAFQCYCLWLYYKRGGLKGNMDNRVHVSGERNSTSRWLHIMQRLGANPVSIDRKDNETGAYVDQLGWRTSTANRMAMIQTFVATFRETNGAIINDYETLSEMESFQNKKSGILQKEKPQAVGGAHDDLVMAYCGYFHCKERGDFDCRVEQPIAQGNIRYGFDPMKPSKERMRQGNLFIQW